MRSVHVALAAFSLVGTLAESAGGATIRVPLDHPTILAGLDAASSGDTVLVAPGIYTATDVRDVDIGGVTSPYISCGFLSDGVVLKSEAGPNATTISSSGGGAVLVGSGMPSSETAVVGFTIASLSGRGIDVFQSGVLRVEDCVLADLDGGMSIAGAMQVRTTSLRLIGCTIARCANISTGGVFCDGPSVVIEACTFSDNAGRAVLYDHPYTLGSCVVSNSRFERNVAGGGSSLDFDEVESIHVRDCVFSENVGLATLRIGGPAPMSPNFAVVERNVFIANSVTVPNTGSPCLEWGSYPGELKDNTFWGNSALLPTSSGCAVLRTGPNTTLRVERNVIGGTAVGFGIADIGSGTLISDCNVFWDNPDGNWPAGFYAPGPNEILADPQLCAPDLGDYTVAASSPCLPANNACGVQIGVFGQGCGPVSVEQKSWGAIKAGYRGGETGN